jgi:hypothetical protein
MSDDIPSLESLLPAEVVAEIRAVIARRLAKDPPPQATIGAKASLILEANVSRPALRLSPHRRRSWILNTSFRPS